MTEQERNIEAMEEVRRAILDGKIYANVNSVSRSGMSRRISFYMVDFSQEKSVPFDDTCESVVIKEVPYIRRVTREVAWLTGWVPVGESKSRGKWMVDAGLYVGGCGMDMVFHTLYVAVGDSDWNQKYSTI